MIAVPVIHTNSVAHRRLLAQAINQVIKTDIVTVENADMSNSWVNYYGTAQGNVKYWKDAFNVVHLTGLVKSGTIGAEAFILPPGYRPEIQIVHPVCSNNLFGQAAIETSGGVAPNVGSNTWFAFDGITFLAGDE